MISIITEAEFDSEVLHRLGFRIRKYTPLIFSQAKESDELKHVASSILLKWKDGFFLALTSHTKTKGKFFTTNLEGFFSIDGPTSEVTHPDLDVKIFRLNQNFIDAFLASGHEFFNLNKVAIQHNDLPGMRYLVVGYPTTRVKRTSEKSKDWKCDMFVFRSIIHPDKTLHSKLKVDSRTHIVLHYEKKHVVNIDTLKRKQGPDLEGISGCGIWRVPTLMQIDNDVNSLNIIPTGMIVREDRRTDALIGTRLPVIVAGLDRILEDMERRGLDINDMPEVQK